jgi:ABC-type amino acid transport system permease subunit
LSSGAAYRLSPFVYVVGHAAAVYGRGNNHRQADPCPGGVILFQSAYVAEVVRGGLQALPKGQYEAAESLALGYWKTQGLVILPQALKLVIPGLVNTIIALFKDTSLVIIIGLFDLFSSVQQATVDPVWLGVHRRICLCCPDLLDLLF